MEMSDLVQDSLVLPKPLPRALQSPMGTPGNNCGCTHAAWRRQVVLQRRFSQKRQVLGKEEIIFVPLKNPPAPGGGCRLVPALRRVLQSQGGCREDREVRHCRTCQLQLSRDAQKGDSGGAVPQK